MSTSSRFNAPIPFCFKSSKEAAAAETAVNERFDGLKAYATKRTLFVPEHKSLMIRRVIEEFVISIGGRRHSD